MFLAYDGDKIGRKLESLLIDNSEYEIERFANKVSDALIYLEKSLSERKCKIIFASGDSVLAKMSDKFDADEIPRCYGEITFSLGMGETPLEAMLALKKAKSEGIAKSCTHSLKGSDK
ncbi:mCpol domain-containing protein [Methylomagnum ishizawai]|uniref:mCpol domain-containing protein n=1 Tax=Methylomagnum ishizawai TaxID=1760988 RepID=UPI001C338C2A|nr:mCpol domain-containing protein [Methylomagnum ishizawai]BBL74206.1 hypothetical protein MishRS11D_13040 [Methylomagnum ishizawai]